MIRVLLYVIFILSLAKQVHCEDIQNVALFPSILYIPPTPQYVPIVTDFEILNFHSHDVSISSILSSNKNIKVLRSDAIRNLPAKTSMIISVVFTPIVVGDSTSKIIINFDGDVREYLVFTNVVENPYQLRAIELTEFVSEQRALGIEMSMVNPHNDILHFYDFYSNSDFFSVVHHFNSISAKSGSDDYRIFFIGSQEETFPFPQRVFTCITKPNLPVGSHDGFISIRTNYDSIMLPVILRMMPDMFRFVDSGLNFGVFTEVTQSRTLDLLIEYSGIANITVLSVYPDRPDPQLRIVLTGDKLPFNRTALAQVTFHPRKTGEYKGTIVVRSRSSNFQELMEQHIEYRANVVLHNQIFTEKDTVFTLTPQLHPLHDWRNYELNLHPIRRIFQLQTKSEFSAFALNDVRLTTCQDIFQLRSFPNPHIPYVTSIILEVSSFIPRDRLGSMPRTCWAEMMTNVSSHRIPLHISDGRIELDYFNAVRIRRF
jgi:hypothetical protein